MPTEHFRVGLHANAVRDSRQNGARRAEGKAEVHSAEIIEADHGTTMRADNDPRAELARGGRRHRRRRATPHAPPGVLFGAVTAIGGCDHAGSEVGRGEGGHLIAMTPTVRVNLASGTIEMEAQSLTARHPSESRYDCSCCPLEMVFSIRRRRATAEGGGGQSVRCMSIRACSMIMHRTSVEKVVCPSTSRIASASSRISGVHRTSKRAALTTSTQARVSPCPTYREFHHTRRKIPTA